MHYKKNFLYEIAKFNVKNPAKNALLAKSFAFIFLVPVL